ncbi:hypothetical protein IPL85_02985 [Candidatus Saccharibacteria bacterium]|nr:MAG: hypothetical protein IPL85_02985 [Candidatus Saccharibacteria bacterium]
MISALVVWWYGLGWRLQLQAVSRRWLRWVDYFSFSILIRTLFAPFRQIGNEAHGGSLAVQFRQWSDRTFSRVVGFFVRVVTLVFGTGCMVLIGLLSLLQLTLWIVVPLLPVIGGVVSIVGWVPWQR